MMGVFSKCRQSLHICTTLKEAQFAFSTHDVSNSFHKLDAPHLVLLATLSFALVVGC